MYSVVVAVIVVYIKQRAHKKREKEYYNNPASQSKGSKLFTTHTQKKEQRDVKQWEKVSVTFFSLILYLAIFHALKIWTLIGEFLEFQLIEFFKLQIFKIYLLIIKLFKFK